MPISDFNLIFFSPPYVMVWTGCFGLMRACDKMCWDVEDPLGINALLKAKVASMGC